jgi:diaminohydroxyphosphoribosylaminopyrimidine deaminase / 5-amino-6-(5-phosphoribosylamino)uracil reductase
MNDADYMARALALAERGRGRTSPNPMVGAVVVDAQGIVVGRGSHEFAGGPHAEVHALTEAGARARGATLYCTLEPCAHTGKTGPCAPLVVESGIKRAVVASADPNPMVAGRGIALLQRSGIDVTVGVGQDEAIALNRPFFSIMRRGRPFVTAKVALSLDACVAAAPGARTKLTCEASDLLVHRERAEVDAIGVGSETILADDPRLTARGIYRARPLARIIFDSRLRTPARAKVFSSLDAGPITIVTSAKAIEDRPSAAAELRDAGARLLVEDAASGGRPSIARTLRRLTADGITSIVIEGGPSLHRAAWGEGVVDRVQIFLTPHRLGAAGVPWVPYEAFRVTDLAETTAHAVGVDVLIEGLTGSDVHWAH